MSKINKQVEAKVRKLCKKFHDELQAIFDNEMDEATYASPVCVSAVTAQGYANDAAEAE